MTTFSSEQLALVRTSLKSWGAADPSAAGLRSLALLVLVQGALFCHTEAGIETQRTCSFCIPVCSMVSSERVKVGSVVSKYGRRTYQRHRR